MRLRDLDAHFIDSASATGSRMLDSDKVDGAQGIMFQCPGCAQGKEVGEEDGRRFVRGAHYIKVYFSNPMGVAIAPPDADDNPRWEMEGTSLDDLTLSPSINCDIPQEDGTPSVCKFHGHVKNGEAA